MYLIKKEKGERKNSNSWNEVAYWRKANHIHKWFVDNVQKGIDDCGYYKVSKKKLEELKNICEELINKIVLVDGEVKNGVTLKDGEWQLILEDGKRISNSEICEELLPTQSGFFFGSTEYDQYYYDDVFLTYEQLKTILQETDFENEYIVYHSSW